MMLPTLPALLLSASAWTAPPPPPLCSMLPWIGLRGANVSYFVATAADDTVLAGEGTVLDTRRTGPPPESLRRPVYGQVVEIDSLAGANAAVVGDALRARRSRRVLVVPWAYDPACETTYWQESARWIEPGNVGFYVVYSRPMHLWMDGMPTFDALYGFWEPYPWAPFIQIRRRYSSEAPSLTPAELMSLYGALPVKDRTPLSLESVDAWVAAHPGLVHRYPASDILRNVRTLAKP